MRFSVCIDGVYKGFSIEKALKSMKKIGFNSFEFYLWWKHNLDEIIRIKKDLDIDVLATSTRLISLTDLSKQSEYIQGLKDSLEAAKKLNCKMLVTLSGDKIVGIQRKEQRKNIIKTLKKCSYMVDDAGVILALEILNTYVDHKGYYLDSSKEAFNIIDKIGNPNIKLLFDIYHMQVMEGNLINNIKYNIEKICHFHAAGNPGRNELYYGEINYSQVFKAIKETGYKGFIGLEYFPVDNPEKGLKFIRDNFMD